jgi:hypothetical protein
MELELIKDELNSCPICAFHTQNMAEILCKNKAHSLLFKLKKTLSTNIDIIEALEYECDYLRYELRDNLNLKAEQDGKS